MCAKVILFTSQREKQHPSEPDVAVVTAGAGDLRPRVKELGKPAPSPRPDFVWHTKSKLRSLEWWVPDG